LLFPGSLSSIG